MKFLCMTEENSTFVDICLPETKWFNRASFSNFLNRLNHGIVREPKRDFSQTTRE